MSADGVEITEKHNAPLVVGFIKVLQNKLNHIFRRAVGVGCAADLHILSQRRNIIHTVNRCRRAENHLFAPCVTHSLTKADGAADIVFIVFKRLYAGFADGFKSCKMYNCVNNVFAENFIKSCSVADIGLIEFKILACNFFDSVKALGLTVIKVI